MFLDAAKEVLKAESPASLPRLVRRAFRVATTGFPGPVVLVVPSDVWEGDVDEARRTPSPASPRSPPRFDSGPAMMIYPPRST